jgi:hypothetical protein
MIQALLLVTASVVFLFNNDTRISSMELISLSISGWIFIAVWQNYAKEKRNQMFSLLPLSQKQIWLGEFLVYLIMWVLTFLIMGIVILIKSGVCDLFFFSSTITLFSIIMIDIHTATIILYYKMYSLPKIIRSLFGSLQVLLTLANAFLFFGLIENSEPIVKISETFNVDPSSFQAYELSILLFFISCIMNYLSYYLFVNRKGTVNK